MNKEVMKLALEALELNNDEWKSLADSGDSGYWKAEDQDHYQQTNKAITALREALANEALDKKAENARELGLDYEPVWNNLPPNKDVEDALRLKRLSQLAEQPAQQQEPVAWVYPEGLEALKNGKPWTAYGTKQEANNIALYLHPTPEREPYAWVTFTPYGEEDDVWYENPEGQLLDGWTYKPLYDTAPPRREWVDLTEVEIDEICLGDEAKVRTALQLLKEKNT